jgi:hypothetical protein
MPASASTGEYLLELGLLSDENLCRALSLFTGTPMGRFDAKKIKQSVRRSLPAHVIRRFDIVPVDLRDGCLVLAGRQILSSEQLEAIKDFTLLAIDFQLTTRKNFSELQKSL